MPTPYMPFHPRHMNFVDFDDVPDGTAIDNHYAGSGITFRTYVTSNGTPIVQGSAYARTSQWAYSAPASLATFTPTPFVASNVISIFPTGLPQFHMGGGAVEARFAKPQRVVSVWVRLILSIMGQISGAVITPDGTPFLEAYDASGNIVGRGFYPIPFHGHWADQRTLTVQSVSTDIVRVQFSVTQDSRPDIQLHGLFDRFGYSERLVPLGFG